MYRYKVRFNSIVTGSGGFCQTHEKIQKKKVTEFEFVIGKE